MPAQDPAVRIEDRENDELLRSRIAEGIRCSRVALVVISEASASSSWVEFEVIEAMQGREARQQPFILGLETESIGRNAEWYVTLRESGHVRDFTGWRDEQAFVCAVEKLKCELTVVFESQHPR
jgi:uncharacterized NAD(P)/FAD-binding protein YdhS